MNVEIVAIVAGTLMTFMVIVVPLWLILHYLAKTKAAKGLSREDEGMLTELWELAGRMEKRIDALETILDDEAPGWRNKP